MDTLTQVVECVGDYPIVLWFMLGDLEGIGYLGEDAACLCLNCDADENEPRFRFSACE